jgi:DNA-binding FadR family transcriptional regulator
VGLPKRESALSFLEIPLDAANGNSLHRQVYFALRRSILAGRLAPGARLPSSRALARRLNLSRNTVLSAYEQLVSEGYLVARVDSGTRVARALPWTYLSELLAGMLANRGGGFRKILQESLYPVRLAPFVDPAGNSLFLFDSSDSGF